MPKLKIGVFDSGVGGESVVRAIHKALPQLEIIYKDDKQHVPYGERDVEEIYGFVKPILQALVAEGCQAIVIACNTVTTNLIERLRKEVPVSLIGMEPMVKPAAAASKSGVIAVCATPRTLSSKRYAWLKDEYAKGVEVLEPDCSDWAQMIENNGVERDKIAKTVETVCAQGADEIVLGCTHYHWIEEQIHDLARGRAEVIQPEDAMIRHLEHTLQGRALQN